MTSPAPAANMPTVSELHAGADRASAGHAKGLSRIAGAPVVAARSCADAWRPALDPIEWLVAHQVCLDRPSQRATIPTDTPCRARSR